MRTAPSPAAMAALPAASSASMPTPTCRLLRRRQRRSAQQGSITQSYALGPVTGDAASVAAASPRSISARSIRSTPPGHVPRRHRRHARRSGGRERSCGRPAEPGTAHERQPAGRHRHQFVLGHADHRHHHQRRRHRHEHRGARRRPAGRLRSVDLAARLVSLPRESRTAEHEPGAARHSAGRAPGRATGRAAG